jgi:hypothetical protein
MDCRRFKYGADDDWRDLNEDRESDNRCLYKNSESVM